MAKQKSNMQHIRDIMTKLADGPIGEDPKQELITEMEEFVDSVEEELTEAKDRISELETETNHQESTIDNLKEEVEELEYDNAENLGVDTLYWKLEQGNIVVTQHMESFIRNMKEKFAMIPS